MRRITSILLLMSLLVIGLAPMAAADVHGVSQANCAPVGVASGAIGSRHAIGEPGRPAAPIPVTASDGRSQGKGGQADAQGRHC
jgi:hypothetical protein